MTRGPGRPQHPVTEDDCKRWLAQEIESLTQRYHEKLEQVRRAQIACDLVDDLSQVYADVAAHRSSPSSQVSLIDQVLMRRNIMLEQRELIAIDAPRIEVTDEGGPVRFATKVVMRITGVSRYAIVAQRNRRRERRLPIIDALAVVDSDDEVEERCA